MAKGIPVRVLNTNRPDHPGTVIHHDAPEGTGTATCIAYKEGQIACTLTSTRMFGEAGFLARAFAVLGKHEVVVDMVATSEIAVSFTTDQRGPLERALPELSAISEVVVEGEKTLLVVVGRQLAAQAGLGTSILRAVADAGVNVEMISFGRKSVSLTMLIADRDVGRAVSVLHPRLFGEG
jgi:aspartate kinase